MIEMWDDLFAELDPAVADHLDAGDGQAAFEAMHEQLARVWTEVERVLVDGGIACVNVGDATRTVDDSFRVFQNHSRVVDAFEGLGFEPLPEILWRKPVNSAAKFMGSGMLPPNAYVTLEHGTSSCSGTARITGTSSQGRIGATARRTSGRSATSGSATSGRTSRGTPGAGPRRVAQPVRGVSLRNSVPADQHVQRLRRHRPRPLLGTGTTTLAAMTASRNSVGYEIDGEFTAVFDDRIGRSRVLPRRGRGATGGPPHVRRGQTRRGKGVRLRCRSLRLLRHDQTGETDPTCTPSTPSRRPATTTARSTSRSTLNTPGRRRERVQRRRHRRNRRPPLPIRETPIPAAESRRRWAVRRLVRVESR